jgi:NAD+ synthase
METINPEQTAAKIIEFIKTSLNTAGFSHAVIGLSGGVDSATSLCLVVRAIGKENVYPVLLPYGILSTQGTLDAMTFTQTLDIPISNISRIDIKPPVDVLATQLGVAADNTRRGNLMARMRMIALFDQAKKRQALVIGTENKSEHLLGYFTRFGDEASDIEPIMHLYKTQVYDLAKFLGVSETILTKKPTAGLWDGQTDEGEFGFTYKEADEILALLYDDKMPIAAIEAKGFARNVIDKITARVDRNAFKHVLPYTF